MILECVGQTVCLAGDIGFNVENLRNGFWQFTIDGLAWGAIYALVAVGYTLVFGVLRGYALSVCPAVGGGGQTSP